MCDVCAIVIFEIEKSRKMPNEYFQRATREKKRSKNVLCDLFSMKT